MDPAWHHGADRWGMPEGAEQVTPQGQTPGAAVPQGPQL